MVPARAALLFALLCLLITAGLLTIWPTSAHDIVGCVFVDQDPVPGAMVRVKGTEARTRTNMQGCFRLNTSKKAARITAWKEGFFIAGSVRTAAPLKLQLLPLPDRDNEDYPWVDPAPDPAQPMNCGNCHGEIYREWSASGHARSADGRHFRNLYDGTDWQGRPNVGWSLRAEHPDGIGVCASCHAPTAAVHDLRDTTSFGVHCDYCHKIAAVDKGPLGLTHGRYNYQLLRPKEGQLFFGPLDDVDRGEDAYSPLYRQSRYCAPCHEGVVFGVHVYSTYSEWLDSPAKREGKQCQTCHMTPTGLMTNFAPGKGGIERAPSTLGNHRFFAGSLEEMLRKSLHLTAVLRPAGDQVRATVEVRADNVGHRVPTGFVDRNLLLTVEGLNEQGTVVPALEAPRLSNLAGLQWEGKPGLLFAKTLKDFDRRSPAPFWNAENEAVDTRLFPGRPEQSEYLFPGQVTAVRVRLVYRRFWQSVANAKQWADNETIVVEVNQKRGE